MGLQLVAAFKKGQLHEERAAGDLPPGFLN